MEDPPIASTSTIKPESPTPSQKQRNLIPSTRPAFGTTSPRFSDPTRSPLIGSGVEINRATNGGRSQSPLPGSVAVGRAFLDDNLMANDGRRSVSPSEGVVGRSSSRADIANPFFGGASGRERMKASAASATSGSGKVISTLQSELIQARAAIDSSRGQLRISQRAVEYLTKSSDDLKESKDRLQLENTGLTTLLARKERLLSESLARSTITEATLLALQTSHRLTGSSHRSRVAELEEATAKAEEKKIRVEAEYEALRGGMQSMSEGWKADLEWLKGDIVKLEARNRKDVEDVKGKQVATTELYMDKEFNQEAVTSSLHSLQSSQHTFNEGFARSLETLNRDLESAIKAHGTTEVIAKDVEREMKRYNRMRREYNPTT